MTKAACFRALRRMSWFGCLGILLGAAMPGWAAEVALAVINGGPPRLVAVGTQTPEGVKVLALEGDSVSVLMDGRRLQLVLGQQSVRVDSGASHTTVNLTADSHGQFHAPGSVNGVQMRFFVDTGASFVSLGRADALRAGISLTNAQPASLQTANGVVQAWRVKLDTVQVGDVTLRNVDGIVHGADMPFVLLGMSFLNRMEMRRDGNTMVLRQRY
jgi:aspartyl protease family protein